MVYLEPSNSAAPTAKETAVSSVKLSGLVASTPALEAERALKALDENITALTTAKNEHGASYSKLQNSNINFAVKELSEVKKAFADNRELLGTDGVLAYGKELSRLTKETSVAKVLNATTPLSESDSKWPQELQKLKLNPTELAHLTVKKLGKEIADEQASIGTRIVLATKSTEADQNRFGRKLGLALGFGKDRDFDNKALLERSGTDSTMHAAVSAEVLKGTKLLTETAEKAKQLSPRDELLVMREVVSGLTKVHKDVFEGRRDRDYLAQQDLSAPGPLPRVYDIRKEVNQAVTRSVSNSEAIFQMAAKAAQKE